MHAVSKHMYVHLKKIEHTLISFDNNHIMYANVCRLFKNTVYVGVSRGGG